MWGDVNSLPFDEEIIEENDCSAYYNELANILREEEEENQKLYSLIRLRAL